ncbi:MAG: hypothetical protein KF878_09795 [Planctomycetes bacterium]|nr:hypothetical protein [Planctomycetota bacterium]
MMSKHTKSTKIIEDARTPGVTIDVPILQTDFPVLRRLDLRLTQRQATALRLVFDGLQRDGETIQLEGVRPVRAHGDAIRWLLDQVADEVGVGG